MLLAAGLSAYLFIILYVFWRLCNASADLIEAGLASRRNRGGQPASGEDHS